MLLAMVSALGRHERLTRGHTERVRATTDLIAERLGIPQRDRDLLGWAALVHDVGKLHVPAEILASPSQPTAQEWQILRRHPAAGAAMVEPLAGWLGEWRLAAGEHHERWDGGGYPKGLAGNDVSLAGRIVAVADAFDVITSTRSYKKAMAPQDARDEMVRRAGTQFDPRIVRALLEVSLVRQSSRFGSVGILGELDRVANLPASLGQWGTATLAAGGVLVAAAASGPVAAFDPLVPEALAFIAGDPSVAPTTVAGDTPTTVPAPPADSSPTVAGEVAPTTVLGETTTTSTSDTVPPSVSTSAAPTTTSAPTTTTVILGAVMELGNPGTGDTESQSFLPLGRGSDPGPLPNFDIDRDTAPGLVVERGDGLDESSAKAMQRWITDASNTRLQSPLSLDLWVAAQDFAQDKAGRFVVGLYDCNGGGGGGGCVLLASNSAQFDQASFGNDFGLVTVDLGVIDHSFGSNRSLMVKVAPTSDSDADLWLAYDTTTFPSRLRP